MEILGSLVEGIDWDNEYVSSSAFAMVDTGILTK